MDHMRRIRSLFSAFMIQKLRFTKHSPGGDFAEHYRSAILSLFYQQLFPGQNAGLPDHGILKPSPG
jgi:hypothetical protein